MGTLYLGRCSLQLYKLTVTLLTCMQLHHLTWVLLFITNMLYRNLSLLKSTVKIMTNFNFYEGLILKGYSYGSTVLTLMEIGKYNEKRKQIASWAGCLPSLPVHDCTMEKISCKGSHRNVAASWFTEDEKRSVWKQPYYKIFYLQVPISTRFYFKILYL